MYEPTSSWLSSHDDDYTHVREQREIDDKNVILYVGYISEKMKELTCIWQKVIGKNQFMSQTGSIVTMQQNSVQSTGQISG